jgi:hypothetical protein
MKLLRTNVRVNPRDSLGQGLDAVMTLVLFLAAGFFLDRWLGTTPWFMIGLTIVAAVGVFYKLKVGYESRMEQHDQERRARRDAAAVDGAVAPDTPTGSAGPVTGVPAP